MPDFEVLGKWLALAGLALLVVGGVIWLAGRLLPQLDQLPGTIKIEGAGVSCMIPLLASVVISVILTVVLNLVIRVINR